MANDKENKANDTLGRLEQSVRQGNWAAVASLTTIVTSEDIPHTPEAMEEYLQRLRRVLVEARIGRASLALSLNRLRAAAKFTDSQALFNCQVSVIPAKF